MYFKRSRVFRSWIKVLIKFWNTLDAASDSMKVYEIITQSHTSYWTIHKLIGIILRAVLWFRKLMPIFTVFTCICWWGYSVYVRTYMHCWPRHTSFYLFVLCTSIQISTSILAELLNPLRGCPYYENENNLPSDPRLLATNAPVRTSRAPRKQGH